MTGPGDLPATRREALALALDAYTTVTLTAEAVAAEQTYVAALAATGRSRLARAAGSAPDVPLSPEAAGAVVAAAREAGRIADPNRAIDWLSTFPAIVELALRAGSGSGGAGATPGRAGASAGSGAAAGAGAGGGQGA